MCPRVVQACQSCRPWKRPSQGNKLTFSFALPFQEEVQFDLLFYRSALQPGLGGENGIPIVHLIDCCIRWSACIKSRSTTIRDLSDSMSIAWINAFGNMTVLTLDGDSGMRGKEADAWAMCSQLALKYKAPHRKAWLVERHNAVIRSALQTAESQVINE